MLAGDLSSQNPMRMNRHANRTLSGGIDQLPATKTKSQKKVYTKMIKTIWDSYSSKPDERSHSGERPIESSYSQVRRMKPTSHVLSCQKVETSNIEIVKDQAQKIWMNPISETGSIKVKSRLRNEVSDEQRKTGNQFLKKDNVFDHDLEQATLKRANLATADPGFKRFKSK